jgi:hypothetical protein
VELLSAMITPAVLISACGTLILVLSYGCVLLIRETRLALRSVNAEMEFVLRLPESYRQKPPASGAP